jgi:hypothetical protein
MASEGVSRYGVLQQSEAVTEVDIALEELALLGFATLDSGFTPESMSDLSRRFEEARSRYPTITAPFDAEPDVIRVLPYLDDVFFKVLFNERLHELLGGVLGEYYIVNQVNGLINPAGSTDYSQAPWHRDLPFRHLTMSRPIAVNALFALDDFTIDNGCTSVLPGSHKVENFCSDEVVLRNARPITARAGTFILLDCMTYHRGGINRSAGDRRAINHVFTIPAWRQQLHLPSIFGDSVDLSAAQKKVLGYGLEEFRSHADWFANLKAKSG